MTSSPAIAREIDSRITLAGSGSRRLATFVLLVAAAHTVTYFVAGAVAFTTLTHTLYEGGSPLRCLPPHTG